MGIKKMKVIFGFPEKRRCCQCKSHMVVTLYHNRWYCDTCFQKKQLCCICGENPVEVTKGDNGYCKKMLREQHEYRFYPVCGCTCILRQSDPAAVFLLDQDPVACNSIGHSCSNRLYRHCSWKQTVDSMVSKESLAFFLKVKDVNHFIFFKN